MLRSVIGVKDLLPPLLNCR